MFEVVPLRSDDPFGEVGKTEHLPHSSYIDFLVYFYFPPYFVFISSSQAHLPGKCYGTVWYSKEYFGF